MHFRKKINKATHANKFTKDAEKISGKSATEFSLYWNFNLTLMLINVFNDLKRRVELCIDVGGGQFENLI